MYLKFGYFRVQCSTSNLQNKSGLWDSPRVGKFDGWEAVAINTAIFPCCQIPELQGLGSGTEQGHALLLPLCSWIMVRSYPLIPQQVVARPCSVPCVAHFRLSQPPWLDQGQVFSPTHSCTARLWQSCIPPLTPSQCNQISPYHTHPKCCIRTTYAFSTIFFFIIWAALQWLKPPSNHWNKAASQPWPPPMSFICYIITIPWH